MIKAKSENNHGNFDKPETRKQTIIPMVHNLIGIWCFISFHKVRGEVPPADFVQF